jgi:hypothetical protein
MKAWLVYTEDEPYSEIVFAETRGKARQLALSTDAFCDAEFIEIKVHRIKSADEYYEEGKWHLDWENPQDRIILVKEYSWYCADDYFDFVDCKTCPANKYCEKYKDFIREGFSI